MWCRRAPFAGKILFGSSPIPRMATADAVSSEFTVGDEIYLRAVWPLALRNLAIGKDEEGNPVYGPRYILADSYGHLCMYAVQFL